ncbi:MAG: type II secretion system protein [Phycisphaerales bacterium]|jgi:prepilin-type N-terminal cleavage/methylation domain-containing protein/prepilin-type processing-associated H-X9-DG protein
MRRGKGFSALGISVPNQQSGRLLAGRAKRNLSKGAGFTLIELLVVIAVIALLMAILVPVLRQARNHARTVVCQANLKQWGTTLALYLEDNEGRFPGNSFSTTWLLTGRSLGMADPGEPKNEPEEFHPIRTKGMLCPMATKPAYRGGYGFTLSEESGVVFRIKVNGGSTFGAWELTEPGPPLCGSYGLNTGLLGKLARTSGGTIGRRSEEPHYTDVFSMRRTAGAPLLFDCTMPDGTGSYDSPPPPYELAPRGSMWRFCMNRHNGHINFLFLDWSVRKVGLKELWTLKWHPGFDTANIWTRAGGVQPEDWPQWMRNFKDY